MFTITEHLKSPVHVGVELTSSCNHRCIFCYNYWRHDAAPVRKRMTTENMARLIDDMARSEVFNVVLTGGEPFLNYYVLLYAVKELTWRKILVSCDTNLTVATHAQIRELHDAGLPHCLVSLASCVPEHNDGLFGHKGALDVVSDNIRYAASIGMRISVNTIVTKQNIDDIYETGKYVHGLGAVNYFVTRVVPTCVDTSEYMITPAENYRALDAALRVRDECGINVGSLVQYPVCFLKDTAKYAPFVGRGCPGGVKMIYVAPDGEARACNQESKSYGNVFDIGIAGVWANVKDWRERANVPTQCKACLWFAQCEGACRGASPDFAGMDLLAEDWTPTVAPQDDWEKSAHLAHSTCKLNQRIEGMRVRAEDGFWLVHVVGAWIAKVTQPVAEFLMARRDGGTFTIGEFPGTEREFSDLITKGIIIVC